MAGRPGEPPPAGSRAASGGRAPTFVRRVLGGPLLERVAKLRPVAEGVGLSMAQLAIAWTLNRDGVSSAIMRPNGLPLGRPGNRAQ